MLCGLTGEKMSRVAKATIVVPIDVDIKINSQTITVNGKNGQLTQVIHDAVKVKFKDNTLIFGVHINHSDAWIQAGTSRALVNSMIIGVTKGFVKKLQLVGVGYRVTIKDNMISLFLGFSHPINYEIPNGIFVECPSHTEIVLRGANKQMIGQIAADLHSYRRPEPYNGKGIRYVGETIRIKNTKKSK